MRSRDIKPYSSKQFAATINYLQGRLGYLMNTQRIFIGYILMIQNFREKKEKKETIDLPCLSKN